MTESKPRLAIIEDNQDLREELIFYLEAKGYAVWGVNSAEAFWRELHGRPADIVLIDLGLPGEDGFSVITYLRQLSEFGLIVISARGSSQDKLRGLDLGADLYLVKPVNFAQLVRDIEALWQRMREAAPVQSVVIPEANAAAAPSIPMLAWTLDAASHTLVDPEGRTLRLTPQEYALVEILQTHAGEVYNKRVLHDLLFGVSVESEPHRIDVILSRLRQKALQHKMRLPVRTLFGRGLVFVDPRL